MSDKLPTVARLYYTGIGARRYRRASTRSGPGEPLCFVSVAESWLERERAKAKNLADAAVKLLCDPGNPDYRARMREALAAQSSEE
ncbi:hypothetical protein [Burkholderia gladioli]|uniref:hypothetical protein n=1 Tax=Burkholderia gladioli TaxID=28095 RepID=UPI00163F3D1A|nr:hypothetical protein [Burkholderia gladioli]